MTFPPYLVGGFWMVVCGLGGDKLRCRGPFMVGNCVLYIIGVGM